MACVRVALALAVRRAQCEATCGHELPPPKPPSTDGGVGAPRHGLKTSEVIEVNIDNIVRSYMREVTKNEENFGDQATSVPSVLHQHQHRQRQH